MLSSAGQPERGMHRWLSATIFISLVAFLLAYFQVLGESRDYGQYEMFFSSLRVDGLGVLYTSRFEPGFVVVSNLLIGILSSDIAVYSVFVIIAMFLKGAAICRISKSTTFFVVVAVFYLARYFPLHELTQLRVAVSGAFLIWAALFFWDGKRLYGLVACAVAVLFHISAAVVIPVLLVRPTKRWHVIFIGLATFVLVAFAVKVLTDAMGDTLRVVAMYQSQGFGEHTPNPFSSALLLDWAMIFFGFVMWYRLSSPMKHVLFIEIIGMAIFYGAIDFAVISHRIREFLSVFWLVFVAHGLRRGFIVKMASAGFVVANIGLYLYLYIFSGNFFS